MAPQQQWKVRRLVESAERFNSINAMIDTVALFSFIVGSISAANKLLTDKLVNVQFFDLSWKMIGFYFFIFFALFLMQIMRETKRQRVLSAFQREATIKAAQRNYLRRR
jgi:hypothetical protein